MPVQNDSVNTIINAFNQGRAEAQQKQQLAQQQEQQRVENEARQKQFEAQQKELEQKHKSDQEQFSAEQGIRESMLYLSQNKEKQELLEKAKKEFQTSGIPPTGYEEVKQGPETIEIAPGKFVPIRYFSNKDQGQSFGALSPQDQATYSNYLYDLQNQAKNADAIKLKQADDAAQETKANLDRLSREKIASEGNQVRLEAARLRGGQSGETKELDKLLSDDELERYGGLPKGTRVRDVVGQVPGIKLNPAQSQYLSNLKLARTNLQSVVDDFNDPKGGGYESYFKTGDSIVSALKARGSETLQSNGIGVSDSSARRRRNLSQLQLRAKEIERLGSALSGIEKPILAGAAPSPEVNQNPKTAKAVIEGYLKQIDEGIQEFEKGTKNRTLPGAPTKVKIKVDANGNEIK